MRLGGPTFGNHASPDDWTHELRSLGYRAAFCPIGPEADDTTVTAYAEAARRADIVIAEVGAWSNPLSSDLETARRAQLHCVNCLELAERIGAGCCVNIVGSAGGGKDWDAWDSPHPDNLTEPTFERIVVSTRAIIDEVKPKRTCYSLETMPYLYPDSPQSYLRIMKAIDRPAFGVHFDPVNLISSPQRYYGNAAFIRECVRLLGPFIKSVHAKDITLQPKLTVHLDEARPGLGGLDYRVLLTELGSLGADLPLMLEHLPAPEDYRAAAAHIRSVAAAEGVPM